MPVASKSWKPVALACHFVGSGWQGQEAIFAVGTGSGFLHQVGLNVGCGDVRAGYNRL